MKEFFQASAYPAYEGLLLTNGLILFTLFLLAIRLLPDFARNLSLVLGSLAVLEVLTSPFYTFGFVAVTGLLYYGLFWLQWHRYRKLWCGLIASTLVIGYFLLLDLPVLESPWTGAMVHRFGIAYSLIRLLSVTLDVGKGRPLPSDPLEFFVYAFFAPTFLQGPIERLHEFRTNLLPETRPYLTWAETGTNAIRVLTALAKGWVATRFFELDWRAYFDHPQQFAYGFLVWGMYARAIGFYLFVSAVNDVIIALCGLAGYRVSENYDYPYFKRNLSGFWRSWHMTLTCFMRDYVYIPLGGGRRRTYLNYLIVFLAIAMWHMTTKAFLVWGLWHGLGMCGLKLWRDLWKKVESRERPGFAGSLQIWARAHPRLTALAATTLTFHYVALGWLPFWGGHPQGLSMILRILSGNRLALFVW